MRQALGGEHPQIDFRVCPGEVGQPGDQPPGGEAGRHADGQVRRLRAQRAGGLVDEFERLADADHVSPSRLGQGQPTGQPLEELQPEARFQAANLLRHRSLGDAQFFGAETEVRMARHDFDHPKRIQRRQALEQLRHGDGISTGSR
ncbi:hypothetical protein D3C81_1714890 [compost metagenome]